MESTATQRIWHKGPPPHVGWWNASTIQMMDAWRWWDGVAWSKNVRTWTTAEEAADKAIHHSLFQDHIEWTDYWPEGARVPRTDPAVGRVPDSNGQRWMIDYRGKLFRAQISGEQWQQWARQRKAQLINTPLPKPHIVGRTRMVDGNDLEQLAKACEHLAKKARQLADSAC